MATLSLCTSLRAACTPTSGLNWSSSLMTCTGTPPSLPPPCSTASMKPSSWSCPSTEPGPVSVVNRPILTSAQAAAPGPVPGPRRRPADRCVSCVSPCVAVSHGHGWRRTSAVQSEERLRIAPTGSSAARRAAGRRWTPAGRLPARPADRVIGAEQHAVLAHHVDQEAQRTRIEHGAVDIKRSVYDEGSWGQSWRTMSRWRQALSTRPSRKAKLPPPWAKQSLRLRGMRSDGISGQDAELGLGGHGHQPGQHPALHAAVGHHVPGMHAPGCPRRRNAPGSSPACRRPGRAADMVADLHTQVAGGAGAKPPGRPGPGPAAAGPALSGGRAHGRSAPAPGRSCARPSPPRPGRIGIAANITGAQRSAGRAVAVHLRHAQRVPQRGVDRRNGRSPAIWPVEPSPSRPGRVDRVQRRRFLPRDGREEVRVHIDFQGHG